MNLTKKQLSVLATLAEKGKSASYFPYMGRFRPAEYWLADDVRATREVEALLKAGLLDRKDESHHGGTAAINKAGRDYLKANKPEKPKASIWWSVSKYSDSPTIKQMEFFGETDSYLLEAAGRKRAKHTDYESWYPSKEAALAAITRRLTSRIASLEEQLSDARKALAKLAAVTEPKARG